MGKSVGRAIGSCDVIWVVRRSSSSPTRVNEDREEGGAKSREIFAVANGAAGGSVGGRDVSCASASAVACTVGTSFEAITTSCLSWSFWEGEGYCVGSVMRQGRWEKEGKSRSRKLDTAIYNI
jgi:hypothetical protein